MVKRGPTSFSATRVAKAGLAASAALEKILIMEGEVSRLRHHVSVPSRRNHGLQKELDGLRKDGEGVTSQKESEPQVVVEPPKPVEVNDVAEAPGVASEEVASSMASEGVDSVASSEASVEVVQVGGRKEVVFDDRMSDLRDRLSDEDVVVDGRIIPMSGYTPAEEVVVETVVPFVPLGPAAMVPVGPREERGRGTMPNQWRLVGPERRNELVRLREDILAEGRGRGRVAGVRNGMGGDSFRTRGSSAHARVGGNIGVRHEGFVPYRRWR